MSLLVVDLAPRLKWEEHPDPESARLLGEVLESWNRTAYAPGQQCRGVAVDCVRFVAAVLDELTGRRTPIETLPADTGFHQPELAAAGARRLRELYQPNEDVPTGVLQPGDVLVTGPRSGGPCHAMITGHQRNTIWHSAAHGVHRVGTAGPSFMGHAVFSVYRLAGERRWRR